MCVWGGLDQRVGGGGGDAAVVVAVARHLDVAEVAPRAAPRVLHQPVVAAVLVRAVPHHQHLRDTHHALLYTIFRTPEMSKSGRYIEDCLVKQ